MTYWCVCGIYVDELLFGIYCPVCGQRIIASEKLCSHEVTLDKDIITIQYNDGGFPYTLMNESEVIEVIKAYEDMDLKHEAFERAIEQRKQWLEAIGVGNQ